MIDIVEQIHALYATHPIVMEAADEIERLRLKVPDRDKLLAEIEHLTVQRNDAQNMTCHMAAEIERLTVYYNLLRDALSWYDAHNIDHLPQWVVSARRALEPKP